MRRARLLLVLAVLALVGCDRYAAEVGYKAGEETKWNIWGDFDSLDRCREAAIAQYNQYNSQGTGRAVSWACLLKNSSGGYESRHR
jgi:hypothetical protein